MTGFKPGFTGARSDCSANVIHIVKWVSCYVLTKSGNLFVLDSV